MLQTLNSKVYCRFFFFFTKLQQFQYLNVRMFQCLNVKEVAKSFLKILYLHLSDVYENWERGWIELG